MEGFVVNKLVQVLSFGSFDEYVAAGRLPASYSPAQVSLVMRGSVWPLGWRSRRKFFNWSGAGTMRNYLCTVAADAQHAGRVEFRIQVEDEPADVTVGATPEELIAAFRARFQRVFMNPIHSSWVRSAEFFFGFNSESVQERVRALPGHDAVLALLEPHRQAAVIPAASSGTPGTSGGAAAGADDTDSDDDDDAPEKRPAAPRDYTRLTEVRARALLGQKDAERAQLVHALEHARAVLARLCATNDEWRALEHGRLARALEQYTAATARAVATCAVPAVGPSPSQSPPSSSSSSSQPRTRPNPLPHRPLK